MLSPPPPPSAAAHRSLRRLDPRPGGQPNARRSSLRHKTASTKAKPSSIPFLDSTAILDKAIAAASNPCDSHLALLPLRVRRAPSLSELRVIKTASSCALQRRRRANSWSPSIAPSSSPTVPTSATAPDEGTIPPSYQDSQLAVPYQAVVFVHSNSLTPSTASPHDRQRHRLSIITEVSNSEDDHDPDKDANMVFRSQATTSTSSSDLAVPPFSHPFKARSRSSSSSSQATIVDVTPQSSFCHAFSAASGTHAASAFPQPPPRAEFRDGSLCSGTVVQGLGLGIVPDDALLDDDDDASSDSGPDADVGDEGDQDDGDEDYRPPQPAFLDQRSYSLPLPTLESTMDHRRARKAAPGFTILLDQGNRSSSGLDALSMLRRPSAPLPSVPLPDVCCVRRDSVDASAAADRYYDAPVSPSLNSSSDHGGIGSAGGCASDWAALIEHEYREQEIEQAAKSGGSATALGLHFDVDGQARRPSLPHGYDTKLRVTGIPWLDEELRAEGALEDDEVDAQEKESPAFPETPPELLCPQAAWDFQGGDDDDAFKERRNARRPTTASTTSSKHSSVSVTSSFMGPRRSCRSDSVGSLAAPRSATAMSFNSDPTCSQQHSVPAPSERKRKKKLQAKLRLLASLPITPPRTTSLAPVPAASATTSTTSTSTVSSGMSINSSVFPCVGLSSTLTASVTAQMDGDAKLRRLASMGETPRFPTSVGDEQPADESQMLAALSSILPGPTSRPPPPPRPARRIVTPPGGRGRGSSNPLPNAPALRETRSTTSMGRSTAGHSDSFIPEYPRPSILVGGSPRGPKHSTSMERIGTSSTSSIRFRDADERPALRRAASGSSTAATTAAAPGAFVQGQQAAAAAAVAASATPKNAQAHGRRSFGDMLRPSMDLLRGTAQQQQGSGASSRKPILSRVAAAFEGSSATSRAHESFEASPLSRGDRIDVSPPAGSAFKERTLGGRVARSMDLGRREAFWSDEAGAVSSSRGGGGWLKKSRSRLRMMAAV